MRVNYTNELEHIGGQVQHMGNELVEAIEKTRGVLKDPGCGRSK